MREVDIWLLEEFEKRKARNDKYSLHAFARDTKLSVGLLSRVFNGNSPIGRKAVEKVISNLNLAEESKKDILKNYDFFEQREKRSKQILSKALDNEIINISSNASVDWEKYLMNSTWKHEFVFLLIDLFPRDREKSLSNLILWLSEMFGEYEIDWINTIQELVDFNLIKNEGEIFEIAHTIPVQRDDLNNEMELSLLSINRLMAHFDENGKVKTRASEKANGICSLSYQFHAFNKNELEKAQELTRQLYIDLEKISATYLEESNNICSLNTKIFNP